MIETVTVFEVEIVNEDGVGEEWLEFRDEEKAYDWLDKCLETGKEARIHQQVFGTCGCGDTVELIDFTNECPNCGALYNSFGQGVRY